jgi:ketosteroid isomerase-like protein
MEKVCCAARAAAFSFLSTSCLILLEWRQAGSGRPAQQTGKFAPAPALTMAMLIKQGRDQMNQNTDKLRAAADAFIARTNAFDVAGVVAQFTLDAVIDDPSTGYRFEGHDGIRHYIAQFFVGYHTVTRFLSLEHMGADQARVRVDFTGDFGHEIGLLDISVNADGLIVRIDADLE